MKYQLITISIILALICWGQIFRVVLFMPLLLKFEYDVFFGYKIVKISEDNWKLQRVRDSSYVCGDILCTSKKEVQDRYKNMRRVKNSGPWVEVGFHIDCIERQLKGFLFK